MLLRLAKRKMSKKIVDGINEYNLSKVAAIADTWTPLEYVAKDENGIETDCFSPRYLHPVFL